MAARSITVSWTARVDGLPTALFVRGFGVCLVYFAYYTVPEYIELMQSTVLSFGYAPWVHAPFGAPVSAAELRMLRWALLSCGVGVALGLLPRVSLAGALLLLLYFVQLDATFYNNHYFFMAELLVLLQAVDGSCLSWPWCQLRPRLARWQLCALRLVVLTPYFYGGLAKLNRCWLLDAEPLTSWADAMLDRLDDESEEAFMLELEAHKRAVEPNTSCRFHFLRADFLRSLNLSGVRRPQPSEAAESSGTQGGQSTSSRRPSFAEQTPASKRMLAKLAPVAPRAGEKPAAVSGTEEPGAGELWMQRLMRHQDLKARHPEAFETRVISLTQACLGHLRETTLVISQCVGRVWTPRAAWCPPATPISAQARTTACMPRLGRLSPPTTDCLPG